jgi:hypothetical protein
MRVTRTPGLVVLVAFLCGAAVVPGAGARELRSPRAGAASRLPKPAACSARSPRDVAPNRWAPAQTQLAPAGVRAIRLCRYAGLNARQPLKLTRSVLVDDGRMARRLQRELDALPSFPPGPVACPFDDGSQIVTRLAYRGGHRVTIALGLGGCARVTNGSVVRTAYGFGAPRQFGPKLLNELQRLTAAPTG